MSIIDSLTLTKDPYVGVTLSFREYLEKYGIIDIPQSDFLILQYIFCCLYYVSMQQEKNLSVNEQVIIENWFLEYLGELAQQIESLLVDLQDKSRINYNSGRQLSFLIGDIFSFAISVMMYYEDFTFGIPNLILNSKRSKGKHAQKFSDFSKLLQNFKNGESPLFTSKTKVYVSQTLHHFLHEANISPEALTYLEDWLYILNIEP